MTQSPDLQERRNSFLQKTPRSLSIDANFNQIWGIAQTLGSHHPKASFNRIYFSNDIIPGAESQLTTSGLSLRRLEGILEQSPHCEGPFFDPSSGNYYYQRK